MPDPTDPRAVADDPSGIVQQMPEGGGGLAPCPFCGGTASVYGPVGWYRQYGITHSCRVFYGGSGDFTLGAKTKEQAITDWNRRATEADLRAEIEKLRALAAIAIDQWENFVESDYAGTGMYDDMIADVLAARAALSPETDGGQDGR